MPTIVPKDALLAMAGSERGPSPWFVIDQERIDRFADATLDRQFIHIDPEKAAQTPFGKTVAHGFLTLSLLPYLSETLTVVPEGMTMAVNYGIEKVRFLQPVTVGSAVRMRSRVLEVREKKPGQILVTTEATVEIRDVDTPALIARTLALFFVA